MQDKVISGALFHAPESGRIEAMARAAVAVDADGVIAAVECAGTPEFDALVAGARADGRLVELAEGNVLMPGLVDLHIHAPQWPPLRPSGAAHHRQRGRHGYCGGNDKSFF